MNCKQYSEMAPLFIYGELPPGERRAMCAHAASCAACRAGLAATSAALAFLDRNPPRFSPEDLRALRVRVLAETARIVPAPRPAAARGFLSSLLAAPAWRFAPVAAAVAVAAWLILPRAPEETTDQAVTGVIAMADDIEVEFQEVAEVCREIDDLNASFPAVPAGSGAFMTRPGACAEA